MFRPFVILALVVGMIAIRPASAAVLPTTFSFVGTFSSPCTGELIAFAGNMQVLIGQFIDSLAGARAIR